MRTLELHAEPKQVQRSDGRGAIRAAAYRSASLLHDERTGQWHDYTNKQGVEFSRIYTPGNAPDWAQERSSLWNAAEAKENRKNSMTAREWIIAFPYEFNAMQRREAGDCIARELMRRYGCAVDICYHRPDKKGDQRNFHAHVLYTTRRFDENTKDGWSKNKYRDLSLDAVLNDQGHKMKDENGKIITRASQEILALREFIAGEMNRIAARDKIDVHTEYLSFEERGVEREPTKKLGPNATEIERKGKKSERGDINRDIKASNDNREDLKRLQEEKNIIDLAIERKKREQATAHQKKQQAEIPRPAPANDPPENKQKTEADLMAARDAAQADLAKVKRVWSRLFKRADFEAAYTRKAAADKALDDYYQTQEQAAQARTAFDHAAQRHRDGPEDARRQARASAHLNNAQAPEPPGMDLRRPRKKGLSSAEEWEDAGLQAAAQSRKPANTNAPPPVAKQFSENGGVSDAPKMPEQRPASFAEFSRDYKPEPSQKTDPPEQTEGQKIDGPKQSMT